MRCADRAIIYLVRHMLALEKLLCLLLKLVSLALVQLLYYEACVAQLKHTLRKYLITLFARLKWSLNGIRFAALLLYLLNGEFYEAEHHSLHKRYEAVLLNQTGPLRQNMRSFNLMVLLELQRFFNFLHFFYKHANKVFFGLNESCDGFVVTVNRIYQFID